MNNVLLHTDADSDWDCQPRTAELNRLVRICAMLLTSLTPGLIFHTSSGQLSRH